MSFSDNYMCRTGMTLPDGVTPVIMNRKAARDAENMHDNNMSYMMYLWRLMDLAMSVFEWRNLPEGVDERMIEYWLMLNGMCVFFYDPDLEEASMRELTGGKAPEGYAVLQAFIAGKWDMYNYPTLRKAYAVNGLNVDLTIDNSVLIFNDYLRTPIVPTLEMYARRLARFDRAVDVNVEAQKTPKVINCTDKQRLTFEQLSMQIDGNSYWLLTDKDKLNVDDLKVLDLEAPYTANDMLIGKQRYWNEALTYLGIENVTTEKKERLISNEIFSNMGDVEAQRFCRLNARKRACDEINRIFGLDVDCDFRSGVYIKADGYGSQNIQTTGMNDTQAPVNKGAGYEVEEGETSLLARIRELIGVGK